MRIGSIAPGAMRGPLGSGLFVALLALSAREARSGPCQAAWDTYPDFQTNVVYAVHEYQNVVYRGGWFSLFQWDGSQWQMFGGGIGGDQGTLFVQDFTTYEPPSSPGSEVLVLGGRFPTAGSRIVNSIATWDGVAFGALGSGVDGWVQSVVVYDGDLIAGGEFAYAGGRPATNIARWDGSAWSPLGSGVYDAVPDGTTDGVWDMVVWQGDLYVVGDFTHAGGTQVSYVARWDGSAWSGVGGGISMVNGGPTGLRGVDVHDGDLVIVGALDFAGGVEAINIARWDGVSWFPVGSGSDPFGGFLNLRQAAHSVASYGGLLYVGADFTKAVNQKADALAVWDGQTWKPVGQGLDYDDGFLGGPYVRDLEVCSGSLLMGGQFQVANHDSTDNMTRYTACGVATGVSVAPRTDGPLQVHLSPNPTTAAIRYTIRLEEPSQVRATLFDARGRRVASLLDRTLAAGSHAFRSDPDGLGERAGVFFLRVEAEKSAVTRKVVLIR